MGSKVFLILVMLMATTLPISSEVAHNDVDEKFNAKDGKHAANGVEDSKYWGYYNGRGSPWYGGYGYGPWYGGWGGGGGGWGGPGGGGGGWGGPGGGGGGWVGPGGGGGGWVGQGGGGGGWVGPGGGGGGWGGRGNGGRRGAWHGSHEYIDAEPRN